MGQMELCELSASVENEDQTAEACNANYVPHKHCTGLSRIRVQYSLTATPT